MRSQWLITVLLYNMNPCHYVTYFPLPIDSFSQEEYSLMIPQIYFVHITEAIFLKLNELFIAQATLSNRYLYLALPINHLQASSVQKIKKIKENYSERSIGVSHLERKKSLRPQIKA